MDVRARLKRALRRYDEAMEDVHLHENHVDALFRDASDLVPHAMLSDMVFYSERSLDEILDEALYREELWQNGGSSALADHVRAQVQAVLDDPAANALELALASRLSPGLTHRPGNGR